MYTGLLHLHNLLRWIILLLLLVAIIRHLSGMNSRRPINAGDQRVDLFLMISAHLTFVIGLYQWIAGPWGLKNIQNAGFGAVMSNSVYRFWAVEHLTGMLIAIVLITIARGRVKRSTGFKAHRPALLLFVLALILIVAVVPWPVREGIGRPLLPGMR